MSDNADPDVALERVTIMVKNPTREWTEPAEVFETPEQAERAAEKQGFDLRSMNRNVRIIRDVPYHREDPQDDD
jgi:hypothetical protein